MSDVVTYPITVLYVLFMSVICVILADGEAPPVEDLVQCNTCKRCFFPKVLVMRNTPQTTLRSSLFLFKRTDFESGGAKFKSFVCAYHLLRACSGHQQVSQLQSADGISADGKIMCHWC